MEISEEIALHVAKVGRPKGSLDSVPRAGRKDLSWSGNEQLRPGDNSLYIRHSLEAFDLPPLDISDPAAVNERMLYYFHRCEERDQKPGVAGLCLYLGIDRKTFYRWAEGLSRPNTHKEIAQRGRMFLEALWEQYTLNGKLNPVSSIFLAKNHFSYVDKSEMVLTPNDRRMDTEPALSPEELQARYLAATEGDYEE